MEKSRNVVRVVIDVIREFLLPHSLFVSTYDEEGNKISSQSFVEKTITISHSIYEVEGEGEGKKVLESHTQEIYASVTSKNRIEYNNKTLWGMIDYIEENEIEGTGGRSEGAADGMIKSTNEPVSINNEGSSNLNTIGDHIKRNLWANSNWTGYEFYLDETEAWLVGTGNSVGWSLSGSAPAGWIATIGTGVAGLYRARLSDTGFKGSGSRLQHTSTILTKSNNGDVSRRFINNSAFKNNEFIDGHSVEKSLKMTKLDIEVHNNPGQSFYFQW